jgi:hypothetical protein
MFLSTYETLQFCLNRVEMWARQKLCITARYYHCFKLFKILHIRVLYFEIHGLFYSLNAVKFNSF